MTESLPAGGPEREIFLRALREYSEQCEAPGLHADCPFSFPTEGGRGCGEDCLNLLAEHSAPPPVDEVQIGRDIGLRFIRPRRPRARRGPASDARPFDATEVAMVDKATLELRDRRTTALLYELKDLVGAAPGESAEEAKERLERIHEHLDELERRGFNVDGLVREGLDRLVAAAIVFGVFMPRVLALEETGSRGDELKKLLPPAGWSELFDDVDIRADAAFERVGDEIRVSIETLGAALNGDVGRRLLAWVATAPCDDILTWTPPTRDQFMGTGFVIPTVGGPQQWMLDRFLQTYLSEWRTSSLRMEWDFIHSGRLPPCEPRVMAERRVDETELAKVLADRFTREDDERERPDSHDRLTFYGYTVWAAEQLRLGNFTAAALVFEATRAVSPDNADAHNDCGFCLLPAKPEEALTALERAAELGMKRSTMNVSNRIFALRRLRRLTSALSLAEDFLTEWPPAQGPRSWMWAIDTPADEPRLLDDIEPREYFFDIAVAVAEDTGDETIAARWRRRRSELLA